MESGEKYDGRRKEGSGWHNIAIDDEAEIQLICDYCERSRLSHFEISVIINERRANENKINVSVSAIRNVIERHKPLKTVQGRRKQGKLDSDFFRAIGRLHFHGVCPTYLHLGNLKEYEFDLKKTVFWDKKHIIAVPSGAPGRQFITRFPRDSAGKIDLQI